MSTSIYLNHYGVRLLGKNQDVPYDGAYFFTNRRGVAKTAMIMPPDRPMKWISKYGSVTISQVGKEMPNGGMNEVGLVVEQTTLWQSSYPEQQELPAIGELQWMQLMLDTCSTVQEVIHTAERLRIVNPLSRLHYMICDRVGECAIFEFLDGALSIYTGESLPIHVMANMPYLESIRNLEDSEIQGHDTLGDYELNSMDRFKQAVKSLRKPVASAGFVFDILQSIQRQDTAFSIVYDIDHLEIHFTSNRLSDRKKISLLEFDFVNDAQIAIDLQKSTGDGLIPIPYSTNLNRIVIESFFRDPALTAVFGWTITEDMISFLAAFPATFQ
ncbi:linear amide C-N hydrolase [Paenibacillus sp. Marseille-Q4541]|uniref:linear amide C-N hydrolase n=1 Tax=Paenibacillus sp. Marseille-Q4541 TaxID=2831522 RepID=UPI001BAE22C2|nr:linear amide C-N hydrolase [Paenibacillus sp. Marseille-Q4541]